MTTSKKNVLVIYSEEGKQIACDIQRELDNQAFITLKDQIDSLPMANPLKDLLLQLKSSDYGILVVTDKDLQSYNKEIIFLAGLLTGNLGTNRVALLLPDGYNMGNISGYLAGYSPNLYRSDEPHKRALVSTSIYNVKIALDTIVARTTEDDYDILYNKKELLRIAVSYMGTPGRYNAFLSHLIKCFKVGDDLVTAEVKAATLFVRKLNNVKQIGAAGEVQSDLKYLITDSKQPVVKCLRQTGDLLLVENICICTNDEYPYEYVFHKSIDNKYVLTIHIRSKIRVSTERDKHMKDLSVINSGYIAVLQLFLRGGNANG